MKVSEFAEFEDGDVIYELPADHDEFIYHYHRDPVVFRLVNLALDWFECQYHPLAIHGLWARYRGEPLICDQERLGLSDNGKR